jgi:hypothetical protein
MRARMRVQINVATPEVAERLLIELIAEIREIGTGALSVRGDDGPDVVVYIVSMDDPEFDPPASVVVE